MSKIWADGQSEFSKPWMMHKREPIIRKIDRLIARNTREYGSFKKANGIECESSLLDVFAGCAFRLQNLRIALQTYPSEKIEEMKKGFEEL